MKLLYNYFFFLLIFGCVNNRAPTLNSTNFDSLDDVVQTDILQIPSKNELDKASEEEKGFIDDNLNLAGHQDRELVTKWIKYFTTKGRKEFERYLARGHYFKSIIQSLEYEEIERKSNEGIYIAWLKD